MKTILFLVICIFTFSAYSQFTIIPIYTATSLQAAEPRQEVVNCFDNDINTLYHSKWSEIGIPDELTFYFTSQVSTIDKTAYSPRQSSLNDVWLNVSISYSTQASPNTFTTLFSRLTWSADNLDKVLTFSTPILNPYAVKFSVSNGVNGVSSCGEMSFFTLNPLNNSANNGIDYTINTSSLSVYSLLI